MAKISAHGAIIGTLEFLTVAKRYMSDGVILKDSGHGWKLHSRLKAGVSPQEAFTSAKERLDTALADNPAAAEYRRQLHALCGQGKRWKLNMAVTLMPNDPDGVWSEACDGYGDNVHADLDDVCALCSAYRNMKG
jgi:hypothetical protein